MRPLKKSVFVGLAVLVAILASFKGRGPQIAQAERPYDARQAEKASIAGYGEIRIYRDARVAAGYVSDWTPATEPDGLDILMISGGGSGGAFSAGVLSAWSAAGTRPHFDVVTGVSTGALIAPFAFLGPAYDDKLVHLFTSGVANNLIATKFPVGLLLGSSLLKSAPMRGMVEDFITEAVLQEVAAEHRKGRRLLALTTNLDTQRAVVWNMGAIANSRRADALKLFQDVLIASASIPGVYPAVMIEAESRGRHFQEMHSDGGTTSQVLILPQAILASRSPLVPEEDQTVNFHVIINNALSPEFAITRNRTLSVIARAYSILLKSQTQSELAILYNYAKLTGARFHLATIDVQVPYSILDPFDLDYMKTIFDLGYARQKAGNLWKDRPEFAGGGL
ncbi:patatin-like phospholipase family protein [Sinorhizobium meliloti]|uniref:patatin-like phospholipase family protein n=1 Tax=Rhizobium meliloti TaxID=382 RepID=UPI00398D12BC